MQRQPRPAPLVAESVMNLLHAEIVFHAVRRHLPVCAKDDVDDDDTSDSGRSSPAAGHASAPFPGDGFEAFADAGGAPTEVAYDGTVVAAAAAPVERLHNSLEGAGRAVGLRAAERLLLAQPLRGQWSASLAVKFIKAHVWPAAFGKVLAQKSRHAVQDSGGVLYSFVDPEFEWLRHVNVSKQSRSGAPRSVVALPRHSVDPSKVLGPKGSDAPAPTTDAPAPLPIAVDYIAFTTGVIYGVLETLGFGGHGCGGSSRWVTVTAQLEHPSVCFSVLFIGDPSP